MSSGVYRITNTVNGRSYIGSSVETDRRFRVHKSQLRRGVHPNRKLQSSWLKYGEIAFEFVVIELVDPLMLIEREQFWIDKIAASVNGLNIRSIAESNRGWKPTPETRAKLRAIRHTPEMNAAKSARQKGRVVSEETRKKLSRSRTGKKMPPPTCRARENMRLAATGRVFTEEAKKAISESKKRANEARRKSLRDGQKIGPGGAVVADTYVPAICKVCDRQFRPKRSPKPTVCGTDCLRIWGSICNARKASNRMPSLEPHANPRESREAA